MIDRQDLIQGIERTYSVIYTGPLKRLIRGTGINRQLSRIYMHFLFRLSGDTISHRLGDHEILFDISSYTEFRRFRNLVGEKIVIEDLIDSLGPDDVFFDIGANVGTYTTFAAAELPSGRIVAFEPEPKNAERLQDNLMGNGLSAKVIQVALSDQTGPVDFALSGDERGEGSHAISTGSDANTIQIQSIRGDKLIRNRSLTPPTVIKIDVEGAEASVLRGLKETLKQDCRLVYVEVHTEKIMEFGDNPEEVKQLLRRAGFSLEIVDRREGEIFIRASK